MAVKTDTESFYSSDKQEAVKRTENASGRILDKGDLTGEPFIIDNNKTGYNITVTAEIFCCAVNNDICAKRKRSLQIRRHKCIIHN